MNKEQWNPGHSLNKGYPYAGVESRKQLPNRVNIVLDKDNVISLMRNDFPEPELTEENNFDEKQALIDFLMSRCFDFQEALKTAEQQIDDMMEDDPFLPEDFGFELVHRPETIHDSPVRVYASKFDDRFSIHREFIDVHSDDIKPDKWFVLKKEEGSDKFNKVEVSITCNRIAFGVFTALGVIMTPPQNAGQDAPVIEESVTGDTENNQ